jgi:hypothetical protein
MLASDRYDVGTTAVRSLRLDTISNREISARAHRSAPSSIVAVNRAFFRVVWTSAPQSIPAVSSSSIRAVSALRPRSQGSKPLETSAAFLGNAVLLSRAVMGAATLLYWRRAARRAAFRGTLRFQAAAVPQAT